MYDYFRDSILARIIHRCDERHCADRHPKGMRARVQTQKGKKEDLDTVALDSQPIWPLAAYFFAVVFVVATMIALSYVLGQRHREKATAEPYEGGIVSTGTSRIRLSANFYLLAMFFVIFDLESVFIFAWAVSIREAGWLGYIEAVVFIAILAAALIYLWRLGAMDWKSTGRRRQTGLRRPGVTS